MVVMVVHHFRQQIEARIDSDTTRATLPGGDATRVRCSLPCAVGLGNAFASGRGALRVTPCHSDPFQTNRVQKSV